MSEQKYESGVKQITANADKVYAVLGNLNNIGRVMDLIPKDKVQDITCDHDSVRFKVDGLGQKLTVRIVDREENKTLKFGIDNVPVQMDFWVQLKQVAEGDTRLKLTIKAELPMMFKMMFDKKLQTGIEQAADMLAQMPYNQWAETV